jgi:hypothetical protein
MYQRDDGYILSWINKIKWFTEDNTLIDTRVFARMFDEVSSIVDSNHPYEEKLIFWIKIFNLCNMFNTDAFNTNSWNETFLNRMKNAIE